MSVQFDSSRNRWVVRWYEAGRQRSRRFALEGPARFDAERHELKAAARDATAARLAGELARLRARAGTIEHQLPADARDTGVYSYASSTTSAWPRSTATSTHRRSDDWARA